MNEYDQMAVDHAVADLNAWRANVLPTWEDCAAASGTLAVHLDGLLGIIARMDAAEQRELASGYVGRHETGTGWPGQAS